MTYYIVEETTAYIYTYLQDTSSFLENPFRLYGKSDRCRNTKLQEAADRTTLEHLPSYGCLFHAEAPQKTLRTFLENRKDFGVSRSRPDRDPEFVVPDSVRSLMNCKPKHQTKALGGAEMAGSSSWTA